MIGLYSSHGLHSLIWGIIHSGHRGDAMQVVAVDINNLLQKFSRPRP